MRKASLESTFSFSMSIGFCACGVKDSVLVFHTETDGHTFHQDNIAYSPWIDLKRNGDDGRPGKLIAYDIYAELPLANYVFVQLAARWYPAPSSPSPAR